MRQESYGDGREERLMWPVFKIFRRRNQHDKPNWFEAELDGEPCWVVSIEHSCGCYATYSTAVTRESELAKRELRRLQKSPCHKCRGAKQTEAIL